MRNFILLLGAGLLLTGLVWAGDIIEEITTTDGITYHHVRFGPVNNGKVVIYHNRGSEVVPVEKLPERWARKFGSRPANANDAAREAARAREKMLGSSWVTQDQLKSGSLTGWTPPSPPVAATPKPVEPARDTVVRNKSPATEASAPTAKPLSPATSLDPMPAPPRSTVETNPAFDAARGQKMVLNGALMNRDQLTVLVGFVRGRGRITEDNNLTLGVIIEIARRKNSGEKAPGIMEMRPGLWDGTGEQVFLRDYPQDVERDSLVRVYARGGDEVNGYKTYTVATELTLEQWKILR